ncbi:hypothetical protein IAD21_00314 [Abditibacteriota bacterium]|nr:hypothetical protein IAD21_00314 [Abditibacteriota bacterium]
MDKQVAAANLRLLGEILDREGIPFWLAWGTCLGAIRDNDIISHDYDMDLEVFARDRKRLLALKQTLNDQQFQILYPWGNIGLKLRRTGEDIDIFFCKPGKRNGKPVWLTGNEIIGEDFFSRLETVNFLGQEYRVPQRPQAYLRYVYGDDWSKKNTDPNYWSDGVVLRSDEEADRTQTLKTLRVLKHYLEKRSIPFCLLGHSCRAAVMGILGESAQSDGESLVVGMYGSNQAMVLEELPDLLNLGFTTQRASYMPGSMTQLLYEGQQIQVKYLFVPEFGERIKNCRWICRWERFPVDFFSRFDSVEVQGETLPIPRRANEYLDYLYGTDFWRHPDFMPHSESTQVELVKQILGERQQLELPVKEPWLPYRHRLDNMLIPYGDTLLIKVVEEALVGMVVLVVVNERLEVRRIVESIKDKGRLNVGLGDLSGSPLEWVAASNVLGQAVGLRSRRLRCTLPLQSKAAITVLQALLPVVRYLKK